jgi:retron-type reverse transcriptase
MNLNLNIGVSQLDTYLITMVLDQASPLGQLWIRLKNTHKDGTIAIEGDIVSAYNNVNHDILLSILRQRIKDKKFLNLINKLLKSGIMDGKVYEHSLEGTPQGGIVSPLLFNIYMFGLDKFVYNEIIVPFLEKEDGKRGDEATPAYRQIRYKTDQSYKRLQKLKTQYKKEQTLEKKNNFKKALKEFKKLRNIRNSTKYGNTERLTRKALYVRYADDWVLTLTCSLTEAERIKQKIADYLRSQRKMQLDDEKNKNHSRFRRLQIPWFRGTHVDRQRQTNANTTKTS